MTFEMIFGYFCESHLKRAGTPIGPGGVDGLDLKGTDWEGATEFEVRGVLMKKCLCKWDAYSGITALCLISCLLLGRDAPEHRTLAWTRDEGIADDCCLAYGSGG